MNKNIILCGVGGQGTVLASKLIASAAMARGMSVMSAETIGMAQKGGSVFSHLRIGDELYSPMIAPGTADIIIGFEPSEVVKMLRYLKKGGSVVVNSHPVMPVTAALKGSTYNGQEMLDYLKRNVENLLIVDCEKACRELNSPKVMNMVMLGAAIESGELSLTKDDIMDSIKRKVKPQFHEINFKALNYISNDK